jgi:Mg-chelatase subunit ChlD
VAAETTSEAVMKNLLARALSRFDRDQRGNVAVLFAFSMVPLIGLLGGSVDVTRHQRYKVELLNAMDAAAIALVRRGAKDDNAADTFIANTVTAMMPGGGKDKMLHVNRFDAIEVPGGYRVVANGYMDTAFLPVIGIRKIDLVLETEVVASTGRYEVALALDNTGSMLEHNKIGALKKAANQLIDKLYEDEGAEDRVKMALVPFTTTVNIRGRAFNPEWLDPKGLGLGSHRFDAYDREVSRLDIFDAFSDGQVGPDGLPVAWKGCVEARSGDFDTDDTAPGNDPATRWTPYLSPDGADRGSGPDYARSNSYVDDQITSTRATALQRLKNVDKYFRPIVSASFDIFDDESGPNQSCRTPIVELTNNEKRMHDAINGMQAGGYTHIPQGLAWGWRVLSPGEPFTQGVEYDDETTQKALVLLSDGKNTFPDIYTSYGYQADGRLAGTWNAGVQKLNERVTTICERVKETGIRLYMILLEENDLQTKQIFEDCASKDEEGKPLYYEVPTASQLDDAFEDIGKDLNTLRITR